jgi:hypothetical protein
MDQQPTPEPERFPQRFKPGNPGRKPGTSTKTTRILRDALLLAAELEGEDGKGKGKLVGYMRRVARDDMKAFCSMLGKVIPLQIETRGGLDQKEEVTYHSVDDVRRELASRGISMEIALRVMRPDLVEDDLDPDE